MEAEKQLRRRIEARLGPIADKLWESQVEHAVVQFCLEHPGKEEHKAVVDHFQLLLGEVLGKKVRAKAPPKLQQLSDKVGHVRSLFIAQLAECEDLVGISRRTMPNNPDWVDAHGRFHDLDVGLQYLSKVGFLCSPRLGSTHLQVSEPEGYISATLPGDSSPTYIFFAELGGSSHPLLDAVCQLHYRFGFTIAGAITFLIDGRVPDFPLINFRLVTNPEFDGSDLPHRLMDLTARTPAVARIIAEISPVAELNDVKAGLSRFKKRLLPKTPRSPSFVQCEMAAFAFDLQSPVNMDGLQSDGLNGHEIKEQNWDELHKKFRAAFPQKKVHARTPSEFKNACCETRDMLLGRGFPQLPRDDASTPTIKLGGVNAVTAKILALKLARRN